MNIRFTQGLLVGTLMVLGLNLVAPFVAMEPASAQPSTRVPDVLRARSIELVGADGNVVAQLHAGEDGSGQLRLRSAQGEVRVKLGPSAGGSSLILMDENAEPAVWLAADRNGARIALSEDGETKQVITP